MDPISLITASLAPAVAMSTSALLATGLHARFGDLVRRIRALSDEQRDLADKTALTAAQGDRHFSLDRQLGLFLQRARLMQFAVLLLYVAILCFLGAGFAIAFVFEQHLRPLRELPKMLFLAGMMAVAVGIVLEVLEMRLAFRIVRYEVGTIKSRF